MAIVYTGATADQYDINNAEPICLLLGSLAEPLNFSHSFAFKENTQFFVTTKLFPLQLKYDK